MLRVCILDVSDHKQLFEDELFQKFMFQESFSQCASFHVAQNKWPVASEDVAHENSPNNSIIRYLLKHFDAVLITGSEDCCMDDSLCYIKQLCDLIRDLVDINFPVFGICFGAQAIIRALFGKQSVAHLKDLGKEPEFGCIALELTKEGKECGLFDGIEHVREGVAFYSSSSHSDAFLLNNDQVERIIQSRHWENQGYRIKGKMCYGLQFHPEMDTHASNAIFNSVTTVPIKYDDHVHELDMSVGVKIAKNFAYMVLHKKNNN
ncbi:hypothetical protein C9374_008388 [Naegleria lovaniensis]|uniref:Glutamine amidotransferase domain-containing protein n=1 Tax=Naegleria lovaniensis TaxID=51637 RepID=A0AA88GK40_NAELO|nr:uncharacterized protein C9374_008388 [Naegleria lovaniensis]KAG2378245.1 hypothetical protein C9374_008388 [Naegleria lovaniensis]